MEKTKGLFVVFEGPDGSGKTTQAELFVERLRAEGYDVVFTREPGGTPVGEKVRSILVEFSNNPPTALTEALLLAAARAQHIAEVIEPALAAGKIVVSDRYIDSTYAYQGVGRGIPHEVQKLEEMVAGKHIPHITFILRISPVTAEYRLSKRKKKDRLDAEDYSFKERVQIGYRQRAKSSSRFVAINGDGHRVGISDIIYGYFKDIVDSGQHLAKRIDQDHQYGDYVVLGIEGGYVYARNVKNSQQLRVTLEDFRSYAANYASGGTLSILSLDVPKNFDGDSLS